MCIKVLKSSRTILSSLKKTSTDVQPTEDQFCQLIQFEKQFPVKDIEMIDTWSN